MASSATLIATTNNINTTAVVALAGPAAIIAKGMEQADEVYVYQETGTEGVYQKLKNPDNGDLIKLTRRKPNFNFEGYGNFKFLLGPATNTSLVVAYVAG